MYWLSSRFLQKISRISKLIEGLSVFASGILFAQLSRMIIADGIYVVIAGPGLTVFIYLFIAASLFFITKFLDTFWLGPATRDANIILGTIRYLYHNMFNYESGHRITFLAQRRPNSSYIRPRYRYAYGSGTSLKSRARFRRGAALAGMAWDRPDTIFMREIPDFNNDRNAFLNFMQNELRVDHADVMRLSDTVLNARWIYCYGIVDAFSGNFVGVLSIDSRNSDARAKVKNYLVRSIAAIIANAIQASSR